MTARQKYLEQLQLQYYSDLAAVTRQFERRVQAVHSACEIVALFPQLPEDRIFEFLDRGRLCRLCHQNHDKAEFTQKYYVHGEPLCDVHGHLALFHMPRHLERQDACHDCAMLYCGFKDPDCGIAGILCESCAEHNPNGASDL